MILLVDNYDSFVHNLARYLVELGCETRVVRDDVITVEAVRELRPAAIVLSPGPCDPDATRANLPIVRSFAGEIPILGVCLGHQAIAAAYGASIVRAAEPVHGRTSPVYHEGGPLFAGLPSPLTATRYHSLVVNESTLPGELLVTARLEDGTPMALAHRELPVYGVQFHPESVLTPDGPSILAGFLDLATIPRRSALPGDVVEPEAVEDPLGALPLPLHW